MYLSKLPRNLTGNQGYKLCAEFDKIYFVRTATNYLVIMPLHIWHNVWSVVLKDNDTSKIPSEELRYIQHDLGNETVSSLYTTRSVTSKKLPNVYKSCPKMISVEKLNILTPLQKLPKNVAYSGKIIATAGFEMLPKVQ